MNRLIVILILLASSIGCVVWWNYHTVKQQTVSCSNINVVCTTTIVADVVYRLAGTCVALHTLMGPGIDPHLYKAKPSDMHLLTHADLIIYNGLHLEGKIADVLASLATHKKVINIGSLLDVQHLIKRDNVYDPHIWHDVQLWQQAVKIIYATLVTLVPAEYHAILESNYEAYMHELTQLDGYIKGKIHEIPREQRRLVTAHDAFSYFGRAYGIEVIGLQGISTDAQVGIQDVNRLVHYLITHKVPALFVESSIPQRTLEAVQQAAAAQGHTVTIGGELLSDALGDADSATDSYSAMMKHNVDTIVAALNVQSLPTDE